MSDVPTPAWALLLVRDLECLPGFPRTLPGLQSYAGQLFAMCGDKPTAQRLISAVLAGADRFPAPVELRRILAKEIAKPKDGLNPQDIDLTDLMSRNSGQ